MNQTTVIRNARLVSDGEIRESDLLVKAGRIERVDAVITAPVNATVVDASDHYLLPGMIDDQVHFREPGFTHKADIQSESRAAIAGGVTSFMDMPNTRPTTTTLEELAWKYARAAQVAAANFGFYFGASNDNIQAVRKLDPSQTCGVKVFMGSSTGNMLVDNPTTLAAIFRDAPVVIATHCESTPMINANLEQAVANYGKEIPVTEHPNIRSAEACYVSTELAVSLAKEHEAELHVLHVSTARELEFFQAGPLQDKHITAETCIHYLHFDDADYEHHGNLIKCNPAIKSNRDKTALTTALRDGRIDIIATDHAPHTLTEKANTDYVTAPSGLPLIQDVLLALLELVHDGKIDLETAVRTSAHNPAQRFGVVERGFIREGYSADLVLIDMQNSTAITRERVLSRCGWTPFEGRLFRSRIESVWVNGKHAFNGKEVLEHGGAEQLQFKRPVR